MEEFTKNASELIVHFGAMVLGAIIVFVIGRILIRGIVRTVERYLERKQIDDTLVKYAMSFSNIALNLLLGIAILSVFGIETTTFAGLLAAIGIAIGMAWSGLLGNFAAGVFLVLFSPFKVGDYISAANTEGTVIEIGLFVTTINSPDNLRTFVGNSKVFEGTIRNFSANPHRRVDLKAQLAHDTDVDDAIRRLREGLAQIPGVLEDPAPTIELLEFNLAGPVLAVRPHTAQTTYWDVYFATNALIRAEFGQAGYSVPATHMQMHQVA